MEPKQHAKKKIILISGVAIFVIAIIAIGIGVLGLRQKYYSQSRMIGRANMLQVQVGNTNQFTLPQDALKSGEIAVVVNDLDSTKQKIADIANQNGGNIYATFIAYSSNEIKNGSVVVQVPSDNFEKTFADLKSVSSQVIEESTQQIESREIYPVLYQSNPAPAQSPSPEKANVAEVKTKENAQENESQNQAQPIQAPASAQPQDKGYIRIVFADYGSKPATITGITKPNLPNNLWVALGIKVLLLIVLIGLLIFLLRKIFHTLHLHRKNQRAGHVVRQAHKKTPRAIKTEKKNKK